MGKTIDEKVFSNWPSVYNCPRKITRVEEFDKEAGVYVYSVGGDHNGFLSKERILTNPNFTPCFKLINKAQHIAMADRWGFFPEYAKKVFIDYTTAEILVDGFTEPDASIGKRMIKYRVGWSNPKWYIFDCKTREVKELPKTAENFHKKKVAVSHLDED